MFRALFSIGGAAGAVIGASYAGRNWFPGGEENGTDSSKAHVSLFSRIPKKIILEYKTEDGVRKVGLVDAHKYSKLVQKQALAFEKEREFIKEAADAELTREIEKAFKPIFNRVPRFADWYFSYSTTYYFLSQVISSTATNAISFTRTDTLKDAVARDIEKCIQSKYKDLVLRPELSDPVLQRGFSKVLEHAHSAYIEKLAEAEREVVDLIQLRVPHFLVSPEGGLNLDWKAQAVKSNHLQNTFERSPEASIGLVAGGTIIGKTVGGMTASKTAASGLASKLAVPFLGTGSGLGAAAAGALAGPGGAVVGAGMGVGLDALLNKGNELMQRSTFEKDVCEAVQSAADDWAVTSQSELHRVVDVWINDSIQILQFT
eukprot:TRINITY_DN20944_c0_g1_i2.p1 TRINITY_DN20944_c0_g1~~TRINITY_DN20944_c0_g1_i2.p1  ORF type:complete len:389 (+),score=70.16 TRINITY_DN20944_c0_g1_i2:48-1169(+)